VPNETDARENIILVLQELRHDCICSFFTNATAIKNELQHSFFHYSIDGEMGPLNVTKNIIKALMYLQNIANILQNMKVFA